MSNIPQALINSLLGVKGFDEEAFLRVHQTTDTVTSIRLNPLKEIFSLPIIQYSTGVPWCSMGRYLPQRPSFTFDPLFHAGAYYVQEASSMFLDHAIKFLCNEFPPSTILDLCGAPGGKSTLLAAAFPQSFLVSNEVIKSRVTILAENISKWGSDNVVVTHNEPKDFLKLPGFFDLMVVDAPCSGSGLFRKDNRAIDEWSEANVEMCSFRQKRILTDALSSLKKNGFLIYSTCSYSKEEDEDICDWIINTLGLHPVQIPFDVTWGIEEVFSSIHHAPGYRFYPDKVQGEGFFISCFQQKNAVNEFDNYAAPLPRITKKELLLVQPWLSNPEEYECFKQKDTIITFPKKFLYNISTMQKILNVRKSGVAIGTIKGSDLIPHHEFALSHLLNPSVPHYEFEDADAINYLKRKDVKVLPTAQGWMLAKNKGLNLGWMKVLPNRINNYYPTDWRILKD